MDYRDRLAHGARERRRNEDHKKMKVMVYREPDLVPYDEHDPEVPYHERDGEVWVDAVYEVCTGCGGKGKYVNPGIDSNGITSCEMAELGPEFEEDYFSGRFDVTCDGCDGSRVMLVPIWDQVSDEIMKEIDKLAEEEALDRAIHAAEMRMGA